MNNTVPLSINRMPVKYTAGTPVETDSRGDASRGCGNVQVKRTDGPTLLDLRVAWDGPGTPHANFAATVSGGQNLSLQFLPARQKAHVATGSALEISVPGASLEFQLPMNATPPLDIFRNHFLEANFGSRVKRLSIFTTYDSKNAPSTTINFGPSRLEMFPNGTYSIRRQPAPE